MHWFMRVERADLGKWVPTTVGLTEKALWRMTSVNQLSFIPEYRKYIGLGTLGTNPNLHYVAWSNHNSSYVTAGSCSKAPCTSLSYHMCSGEASSREHAKGHAKDESGIQA